MAQQSYIVDAGSCREMQADYYEKVANSATTFLARWNGGSVRVLELRVSLRSLVLVVFRDYSALRHE